MKFLVLLRCQHARRASALLILVAALSCAQGVEAPRPQLTWAVALGDAVDELTGLPGVVRDKKTGIELVLVPAGEFTMGAQEGSRYARGDNEPAHRVRISKPFYLGRFPVLQSEWVPVMGTPPNMGRSGYTDDPRFPVVLMNWSEAHEFCRKTGFRLPTEAEWEYACRAGTTGPHYGNLDDIAWHRENGGRDEDVRPVD